MCLIGEQLRAGIALTGLARPTHCPGMSYHQSLRWVLTDGEAARLAFDAPGAEHPWTRSEPWFVRLRHDAPRSRVVRRAS